MDLDRFFIMHQISILGAYSLFLVEIFFAQWYEDGWLMLIIYLMTLTLGLILEHISPFSLSILEIETMASLVLDYALVYDFRRSTISGLPYMVLLR